MESPPGSPIQAAGLEPAGRVGVLFKRLPPGRFHQLEGEVGYDWLVRSGGGLEEPAAAHHTIAVRFTEEGVANLLLACLFRFRQGDRTVFWVSNSERSSVSTPSSPWTVAGVSPTGS